MPGPGPIISGTPAAKAGAPSINNISNGPGMAAPLGKPSMLTLSGPVLTWLQSTWPQSAPHFFIVVVPVPGPGTALPGVGVPSITTVLHNGIPVCNTTCMPITIPGPGPGAASGTPLGPCTLIPI